MRRSVRRSLADLLPHGYSLDEADFRRRHRLLLLVLAVHVPALVVLGLVLRRPAEAVLLAAAVPGVCLLAGATLRRHRRVAAVAVTAGLVYCSAALVGLTGGLIEAHFHFFIIIGFIALYQDWVPFLFNVLFTVVSHGVGSIWQQALIFNHPQGQQDPWLWSLIHGVAVLIACVGMVLFWRVTEDSQREKDALQEQLAESELRRRTFASDMLVNLARRNQSMLYKQLEIINQLEESEQDPDALAELFKLDHLATRVQRNAESLLVLSGEQPARVWREPVPLRDVVRAAIAETEDLDRVSVLIDDPPAIAGHSVTDVTHLLAELTENAVRFSPPDSLVRIRMRPDRRHPGGRLVVIEDWGVGMPFDEIAAANEILAEAPDVDLAASQRLGFHVVARLSARHGIRVSLAPTPGAGTTAVVALPPELFDVDPAPTGVAAGGHGADPGGRDDGVAGPVPAFAGAGTGGSGTVGGSAAAGPAVADPTPGFARDDTLPGARAAAVTGAATAVVPAQRSEPVATGEPGAADAFGLRRRVPQAHLAPELRDSGADRGAMPAGQAAGAAQALVRFQSGRRGPGDRPAAVADAGVPPSGGTWFEPVVPPTGEGGRPEEGGRW